MMPRLPTPVEWSVAALILWAALLHAPKANAGELYFEVGAHENVDWLGADWEDSGSKGAYFGLRYEFDIDRGVEGFVYGAHYSNWTAGKPYNDDPEDTHDVVGIGVRLNLTELFR